MGLEQQKEQEIHITIDNGVVKIEVVNGSGSSCKALTKPYEDLFSDVKTLTLKPEYTEVKNATSTKQRDGSRI